MTPLALTFPAFDPVLIEIGPLAIRWYALAYLVGLFGGVRYARYLVLRPPILMKPSQVDDFLIWVLFGIICGGRFGYVLFYKPAYYLAKPAEVLMTWEGGMSFHGGLLGVILAIILFARKNRIDKWYVSDLVGCAVPIGIFLGRVANFVNGELYGRFAPNVPWAMAFPNGGPIPRHPSQLYEAMLEGLLLFLIMHVLWRKEAIRSKPGTLTGCFCVGYGVSRIIAEFFREPDRHLGFIASGITMGQILSLPMILFGIWVIKRSIAQPSAIT
ncbi:MAG: prolipoprotein diacylglyceryl transferase [Rhodospirillaceae bacterium]